MRGRLCLLSFIVASASVQILPKLSLGVVIAGYLAVTTTVVGIGLVAFPANTTLRFNSRRLLLTAFLMLLSSLIGFTSTLYRADARLNDQLSARDENKVSRVTVRVNSLVRISDNGRRFEGEVLSSQPEGIPKHVLINWYQGRYAGPYAARNTQTIEFPDIIPGQIWSMALTLKQVHGLRNPHGFDYEGHLFAQGIRTTGNVRGQPQLIDDQPFHSLRVFSERVRHHVRASMQTHIEGMRYGAVLLALAIGDQASVEAPDWRTFNLTGITHLVSISGTHVTLIASLGGLLVYRFWRRWQWRNKGLAERCPAQIVACLVAVIIAWCYCLLAGWGIPAQRTFLMLAIVAGARLMRLSITASRLLILAAFIVVAFDPWAILASGFWLSFSAVCILLTSVGWWGQPSQLL
ncbi:MAG TPA: ComEC/Rec2 family competence protein, partial [Burkholderiaceae bacterium]|nr:ComEC/Rec2 family competence protein [Burkholderiaceae bacterium]